ncbi:hypothetical protein BH09ACT3_BH09ACT3_11580 [soil metagenome]
MNPTDPVQQLAGALTSQANALERVLDRAESAYRMVPQSDPARWRGPASLAFELALQSITAELGRAMLRLAEAASESRRAASGMHDHG